MSQEVQENSDSICLTSGDDPFLMARIGTAARHLSKRQNMNGSLLLEQPVLVVANSHSD